MEAEYKHTQFGAWTIIVFLIVGLLIAPVVGSMLDDGRLLVAIITIALLLLGLAMFYALTVQISNGKLKFWFGIGLINKTYPFAEIQSTREVKDPWYYFWGIKSIPGGWLYAAAPGEALEIVLQDGKIIHVGTNQSKQLKEALDMAMSASKQNNQTSEVF